MHAHAPNLKPTGHGCPASASRIAGRRLGAALLLSLLTATGELLGARYTGSLALLADAGHVAFDSLAIALAWVALRVGQRPATAKLTFGFARAEVLAACANGLALLGVAASLASHGIGRIAVPLAVEAPAMMGVAAFGLVCNGTSLYLLESSSDNMGVRAAFLHVAGDVLVALGVLLGGAWMLWTGSCAIDGWMTVAIAVVLAVGAVRLLASVGRVLMEAVPPHLDGAEVRAALMQLEGVGQVLSLRLWSLTPSHHLAMVHLEDAATADAPLALSARATALLQDTYGIREATVQVHPAADLAASTSRPSVSEKGVRP